MTTWDLTEDDKGLWSGSFERRTAGLADFEMRATFRGLSPAQRRERIYEQIGRAVAGGRLERCRDHRCERPAAGSGISRQGGPMARALLPQPDIPWLKGVLHAGARPPAAAERRPAVRGRANRAAAFYRGRRSRLCRSRWRSTRRVRRSASAGGNWDARTAERVAEVSFTNPTVSAADYTGLRKSVRDWTAELAPLGILGTQ